MMRTLPVLARARPARMLISVVFPAPFGPSRPKNSPSSISRSMPASACRAPKRLETCRTSIAAIRSGGRRLEQFGDSVELGKVLDRCRQVDEPQRHVRALGLAHPFQSQRDCRRVDFGDGRKIDRVGALTEMFLGLQDQSGHRVERHGALEHQHLAFASNHPGHTDNFVCRIVDCPARKIRKGAPSPLFNFPEPDEPESNGLPSSDATALWISDRCNCATVRNPETYT